MKSLLLLVVAAAPLLAETTNRFVFDPASVRLDPRLDMTLWAAEPDVVDPVAIAWDEQARAYVVECRDYPYGVGPEGAIGSTLRRLEDTNGDGLADKSTVFARNLSYATCVTPWRGGVLVTAAPDILFLKDSDGDGVADVREVILTGFVRGVSDSLVNGLRYGLDGRIHGANGGNGGTLSSPKRPGEVVALGEDDFALNPDTGQVERTGRSGGGFGLVFDDFGRAFTTYNIDHLQHRFLSRRQAERFPGFPPVALTGSISDHGEMSRIFLISTAQTRPNHPEQAGHFSAAGGMGRVASGLFPDDLRGSVFVGDVVGNLVHRDMIVSDGPIFRATRGPGEQTNEFFASRDSNCRPVGLETGPDGALYLLDMQRDVIEHPDYIPAKVRAKLDVRAGQDRGRIYRIAPKNSAKPRRTNLGRLPDSALVAQLGDDNQWVRLTAQRLLAERRPTAAIPALHRLATESPRALARLHGLWALEALGALTDADLQKALTDTHPGVRENALWLAEPRLPTQPSLADLVLSRLRDSQPRVRFVAAQVAGAINQPAVEAQLAELWWRDLPSDWIRRAVLSSLRPEHGVGFAGRVLDRFGTASIPAGGEHAIRELADLIGARAGDRPADVSAVLERTGLGSPLARALAEGLAGGLGRSGAQPTLTESARRRFTERFAAAGPEELRPLWLLARALGLPENVHQSEALVLARAGAMDPNRAVDTRVADVRILGLGTEDSSREPLLALLDAREPVELQRAALSELRRFQGPAVGAGLVARWRTIGPAIRTDVLNLILERRAFHPPLLEALESGAILVGELNLDLEQRRRLLRGGTASIRERAVKFMADEEYSGRKALVDDWLAKLPAQGDAGRGRKFFEEACAKCHVCGAVGKRVGPDLTGLAHRSVEDLVSNILDPNMALNPGFVAYTVETIDGEAQTGLLVANDANSITLLLADEQRVTVPRRSVLKLEANGRSLMPEGLEAGRSRQDLRDLVEYLQGASRR